MLDRAKIKEIIPHREPFLLLDTVTELKSGHSATGNYYVDPEADWFRGHFPGYPVFPGVLQVESLAQLGAVAILSQPEMAGKLALFAGLESVRFRQQVLPGATLNLTVEIVRARASFGVGQGSASVDGKTVLESSLKFALVAGGNNDENR
ncbi:MAG: 3-hydroxyacyl-ACP dehydratase FabZ [Firmicutes bacterium]|nr:3-hydroxyacyl-ACP dehydratase FabZ [Bacillota bacterium]